VRGDVTPPILSGRLPRGEDEIVLGRSTLADANVGLGERVSVSAGGPERELTVVGTAVLPALGPIFAEHTGPGNGALVTSDAMAELYGEEGPPGSVVLLRFRDGRDPAREVARLATSLPSENPSTTYDTLTEQRPADITNAEAMGSAPRTLAAVLAVAALASVALTVATSARRRRGDLALLKAIGFTRRQISAAVAWQTSVTMVIAAVVGSIVGLVAGRVLWRAFADQLDVVPDAPLPVLIAVGVAAGLVVVANVVTAPLARAAGRTPTATVLRAE
jgi:putative ABC transport system permease protein